MTAPLVWLELGAARLVVLLLPFRVYAVWFGAAAPLDTPPPPLTIAQQSAAKSVRRRIQALAQLTPWRALCLEQAIVAGFLLRRRHVPHVIYFGVCKPQDAMKAHVWILAGPVGVTGAKNRRAFTIVAAHAHEGRG